MPSAHADTDMPQAYVSPVPGNNQCKKRFVEVITECLDCCQGCAELLQLCPSMLDASVVCRPLISSQNGDQKVAKD